MGFQTFEETFEINNHYYRLASNGVLLACGSTDGHVRVFLAILKGIDAKPDPSVWGTKLPFQTLCGDYTNETNAWIHGVKFSQMVMRWLMFLMILQ